MNKGILLSYAGLPPAWATCDTDEINIAVETKLQKAMKSIVTSNKAGGVVYFSGHGGYIMDALDKAGAKPLEAVGVNFPLYFEQRFSKDGGVQSPYIDKKITIVYNVGVEGAVKRDFPSRLLQGLIKSSVDRGGWVFIVGTLSKTEFEREYGITIQNSLRLPEKKEPSIF